MLKSSALALVLLAGAAGGASAQVPGSLGGYDLSPFETQSTQVAVATDKQSGRKFNVVKLPNGKMMVLMSAEKVDAFSPFADDSEMMYSGHRGTTR